MPRGDMESGKLSERMTGTRQSMKLDRFSMNPEEKEITGGLTRECLAEVIGTYVLVLLGDGVVAQTVLTDNANGSYLQITLAWGLAVTFGIYASGGVSGAHLNPAVTLSLALFKKFPFNKVPAYIASQFAGAILAAFTVWIVYYDALQEYLRVHGEDGEPAPLGQDTCGVFCTFPAPYVSQMFAFLTEIVGTAMLMLGIFACIDQRNQPTSPYSHPGAIGALVMVIGMSLGSNSGYAINPARDLGPRIVTAICGWGADAFTYSDYYFWVPIVGPLIGGPLGSLIYSVMVEWRHPKQD